MKRVDFERKRSLTWGLGPRQLSIAVQSATQCVLPLLLLPTAKNSSAHPSPQYTGV